MSRIDHAALWVADLVGVRDFYLRWFSGRSNGEYHNPRTGLRTFIISFDPDAAGGRGARLELMSRPDVIARPESEALGWAHVSFALPGCTDVDELAARARAADVPVVDGPRRTGDGYYGRSCSTPRATASRSLPATTPTRWPSARDREPHSW